jgi:hypothetical protein
MSEPIHFFLFSYFPLMIRTHKAPWSPISEETLRIIEIVFWVAVVGTLLGLVAYLFHATPVMTPSDCPGGGTASDATPTTDNAACPPRDERGCQSGALFTTSDDTQLCDYVNHAVGTSCTSACHVEDTETACTADGACDSDDPTTCLGYCETDAPSDESSQNSASCEGKLTFLPYFLWGGEESSCDGQNWLYYSNFTPECHKIEGCRWFSTVVQLLATQANWYTLQASTYPGCLDMLNMTNVGCIRAYRINFTETFANTLFHGVFDPDPDLRNPQFRYSGYGCIYNYACGVRNETYMSDPDNIIHEKRVLAPTPTDEALFTDLVAANAPMLKSHWSSLIHRMKRVTCTF